MKKIILLAAIPLLLAACTKNQPNLPNPASAFCEQNGNKLEIQTAADGSQSGLCIFPDGSSCDEWAYYRGECGPATPDSLAPSSGIDSTPLPPPDGGSLAPGAAETVTDWWGVIKSNPPGAQFDDYFERQDSGQTVTYGIDSLDPAVRDQIVALRDSGKIVHLYGTLLSDVPDVNGFQIQVERIEVSQ